MRTVGTAEGIGRFTLQLRTDGGKKALRQYHVGVEYDEILALCPLGTVVAALSGTAVLLGKVGHIEPVTVAFRHTAAVLLRPVFNDYHLKVSLCLSRKAVQQLVNLVGTVVNGHYYGVFHGLCFSLWIGFRI